MTADHGELVRRGQDRARARGVRIGRPSVVTADVLALARAMRAEGRTLREIARALGVGLASVHRALQPAEAPGPAR